MLRINQQSNAAAAKSYYASPAEYYGAGEQEQVGVWGGKAADRLGLHGEVQKHHFERLCDNRHPFTGERLTARMRADRRVGYDFNFHACKSLSILYAVTGDSAILDALREAVRATMEAMEAGVRVRVRKRGRMSERTVGNMAWMEAIHFTARPVEGVIDPHLHIHCFVANACWDQVEGMWKAIDVASVKENAPHWQAMFQRRLAGAIGELGYAVEWKGKSWEVAGISRDTIERFSGRTALINRTAEQRGVTDPRDKDKLGAMTRERKRKDATMPALRAQWRQRLTDGERAALALAALRQRRSVHPLPANREQLHGRARHRQRLAALARTRTANNAPALPAPRMAGVYGR